MTTRIIHAILAAILTAIVGFFPYIQRRDRQTRLFALSNLALILWNLFDFCFLIQGHDTMVLIYRLGLVVGIFTVWFFYLFIVSFGSKKVILFDKIWIVVLVSGIILIGLAPTPILFRNIDTQYSPFREIPGPAMPLLVVFYIFTLSTAFAHFIYQFRNAQGILRNQMAYLLIALGFAFAEAMLYFLSLYVHISSGYYYYLQVIYTGIIAYAIVKHQLMDIAWVIRNTLIYSLVTGVLAVIMVFVATALAQITKGFLGESVVVSSALAACLIVAIFHPLQLKVQLFVDRHFLRRYLNQDLVRDIAGSFAHELKSPLAGITLPAELTLMDLKDLEQDNRKLPDLLPKLRQRLEYILSRTVHAGERIEAVRSVTELADEFFETIDLVVPIQKSLAALAPIIKRDQIEVSTLFGESRILVKGNAIQLEIVFTNLIKNALESMASTENPKVLTLSLEMVGAWVNAQVRDAGCGIPKQILKNVFGAHFSTKTGQGMGLGLYLTRQIVEAHGGEIDVRSEVGKGTTFILRIPWQETQKAHSGFANQ